jgi:hypothetical protein
VVVWNYYSSPAFLRLGGVVGVDDSRNALTSSENFGEEENYGLKVSL